MVGFFKAVTRLLSSDAVRKAVADTVPANFRELNWQAFDKGYEYGLTSKAGGPPELEEVGYASESLRLGGASCCHPVIIQILRSKVTE